MCGLNGVFAYNAAASAPAEAELLATRDYMRLRGPDGAGAYWSEGRRCGLGHRRLSIIDLSDAASHPMHSADGSLVIVFNGEIYNYRALRAELEAEGATFRTLSDTEVVMQLYERRGEAVTDALRGMYALAIWDSRKGGLFIARDPYGIKPLYTANDGWTFRFASQVKALLAGGQVSRELEPAGVVGFNLLGSVPEPFTLYRDIRALPAGHSQWIDAAGPREPRRHTDITAILAEGAAHPAPAGELAARVRDGALDSVRAHLVADVEVGVFLSAGVDSGALLGLMRDAGQDKVRAITLGFEEFRGTAEDETPLAAQVAERYGAEHIVRTVSEAEFRADLPAIFEAMDQPSIDGINTWFVAKAAHEAGLKVALSGLGGDELLAGYPSFRDIPRWVGMMRAPGAVPGLGPLARRLAMAVPGLPPKALGMAEYGGDYPGAYLLRRGLYLPFELDGVMDAQMAREGLRRLRPLALLQAAMTPTPRSPVSRVAALESAVYMRNQLLRDSDWAGMAHSLEIRTPLVDIELLRRLAPVIPHLSGDVGKRALAAAPSTPLPSALVDRPKTGFGVPTGRWLSAASDRKGAASRLWSRQVLARQTVAETARAA
jgi:asparagine synthase (glutamine-hydrolysing)